MELLDIYVVVRQVISHLTSGRAGRGGRRVAVTSSDGDGARAERERKIGSDAVDILVVASMQKKTRCIIADSTITHAQKSAIGSGWSTCCASANE